MKKTTILGILSFLLTGNLICQVQSKDIYDVLNQLIEINNVTILSKKAKSFDIEKPSQNEFIDWCTKSGDERIDLSQVDSAFIMEQVGGYNEIKWDKKRIDKKIKTRKKSIDYFTIPLFLNKKKDLFIVYHRQYVGLLAAEGKYELYKKTDINHTKALAKCRGFFLPVFFISLKHKQNSYICCFNNYSKSAL